MKLTRVEKFLLILDFVKDSVRGFWQKIYGTNILKASACLSVLFITLIIVFSYKPNAQSLPSCSTLAPTVTPVVGVNCLYFGLPLCSSIVAPDTPKHRVNCADLIDLPLCSDIVTGPGVSVLPGKNCVDLCSSAAYDNPDPVDHPDWLRSIDFAIYNKDCMRFCDDVEDGVTPQVGVNCSERKCHQLPSATDPNDGVNCNMAPCNLLTPDELNKAKFDDSTKKYCEGSNLKCYQFTASQLKYMRVRPTNPTCIIHNCAPSTPTCGANDLVNITNQGSTYVGLYQTYINSGLDINSNAFCTQLKCKPVIKTQYRCTAQSIDGVNSNVHSLGIINSIAGDDTDIYRNPNCDSSGDGSVCGLLKLGADPTKDTLSSVTNYCYKTVDCNLAANSQATECLVASNATSINGGSAFDPFDSWFYRPKPADKSVNTSTGLLLPMEPELCYTEGQMQDRGWGQKIKLPFGIWGVDFWFHSSWIDSPRSPGACGVAKIPDYLFRGTGYIYVCGTSELLYNKASQDAVYFKGYARTDFSGVVPKHTVTVCTRYANTVSISTCGARDCGVDAWFDHFTGTQSCGFDVCKDLVVSESDPSECMMREDISDAFASTGDCAETIDDFSSFNVRLRAVKYDDKICAFFDSKGQTAYDSMYFDGTESISFNDEDQIHPSTVCVNDPNGVDGNCHGYDSASTKWSATKWRNMLRVHYVDNNRPAGTPPTMRGYLDRSGKLYKEQACPKVTLRLPPPDLYNIGTMVNSEKLFSPPLSIRNVTKARGGEDAIVPNGAIYGKTDFHFPEMKVQFGQQVYNMSLGFGYTGYEDISTAEVYPASPGTLTISTAYNGRDYEARLFVRKEFSQETGIPQFCLYRKIKDQNGLEVAPLNIGCVERNAPDINNSKDRLLDKTLPVRRMVIAANPANQYNNSQIDIRYLDGGPNNTDNNCSGDDNCTQILSLANPDYKTPVCSQDNEQHKICVQRDECSAIYIDCIQNEIDLSNAKNANANIGRFLDFRKECNENLVTNCNKRKGVTATGGDIYAPIPADAIVDDNAYGWFNELCIVTGFNTKLKNVIARVAANGVMGKCVIDPASPYLKDNNPATNCNAGGRAPNCLCAEAPDGYTTTESEVVRRQTPHEAGLCIDMPIPPFCPLIDYNPSPNPDDTDPEYIASSLGKTTYNNTTGVHLSHKDRANGVISGYAEFPKSLPGMNDVRGECKGFWTYNTNSSGVTLFPMQSCLNNAGNAVWDQSVRNQCVRFSCPDILTSGPDITGLYQGGYGVLESGEAKGLSNAFALWNKYTKTNDFPETRTAYACIPGFKPLGSNPVVNGAGMITSYNGGALPSRQCDQLGKWNPPVNACTRIYCPAINLPEPRSSADIALWTQWYANGGASFPIAPASRSIIRVQSNSVVTGTCNNNIGFYQSQGGSPPTLECDYLGNWGVVKNPCTTSCDDITDDIQASNGNNGFSKWEKVTAALTARGIEGVFTSCASGYVTNPYPPTTDINGSPLANANDLTRPAENPRRLCKIGSATAGVTAGVWGAVSNGCINQCPGADVDPRVGVGITIHPVKASIGGTVEIRWPSTAFGTAGQYAYVTNADSILESQFNATYFQGTSLIAKNNNYYLLRRFCNPDGKWSEPEVMCSLNDGQIGNAKYNDNNNPAGYKNSIAAGTNATATGTCISNSYWYSNRNQDPAPQKKCVFADANQYIDRVYLDFANNTKDCEMKTCPNYPGFTGLRGQVPLTNPRVDPNNPNSPDPRFVAGTGQLIGSCINSSKNSAGTVVYAGLEDGGTLPFANCDAQGNWTIPDESSCKYGCDMSGSGRFSIDIGGCGGGNQEWSSIRVHSLKHAQSLALVSTDSCGGWNYWNLFGETCNDGVPSSSALVYGYGPNWSNGSKMYNPSTNKFDGPVTSAFPAQWKGRYAMTLTNNGTVISSVFVNSDGTPTGAVPTLIDKYNISQPIFGWTDWCCAPGCANNGKAFCGWTWEY